jgi:hypothetical protein
MKNSNDTSWDFFFIYLFTFIQWFAYMSAGAPCVRLCVHCGVFISITSIFRPCSLYVVKLFVHPISVCHVIYSETTLYDCCCVSELPSSTRHHSPIHLQVWLWDSFQPAWLCWFFCPSSIWTDGGSRSNHLVTTHAGKQRCFLFIIFHRRYLHLYLYTYYCTIV